MSTYYNYLSNLEERAHFAERLLNWYSPHDRPMPWKEEKDPYKIWISEIMLQQTRVEQAEPYYNKFITLFPDVESLASAPLNDVLSAWEGLGYYSRARNMHVAAQQIMEEHRGRFPRHYKDIIGLKGIGPYTAAAISSFAFKEPRGVLDGNVIRIITRIFGIPDQTEQQRVRKKLQSLIDTLVDHENPDHFNQAIMDLGATVCTPKMPLCTECCFNDICKAFQTGRVHDFPSPRVKKDKKPRYFHYAVVFHNKHVLLKERKSEDIWKNLFEFPMVEKTTPGLTRASEFKSEHPDLLINKLEPLQTKKQVLSHQIIHSVFYLTVSTFEELPDEYIAVDLKSIENIPMPKSVREFTRTYFGD